MFLSTNSLSILYTFPWEYYKLSLTRMQQLRSISTNTLGKGMNPLIFPDMV